MIRLGAFVLGLIGAMCFVVATSDAAVSPAPQVIVPAQPQLVVNLASGRNDEWPLKIGSAGPRVCDLQHLLRARRPSVYRSSYFAVRKAAPSCYFGAATRRQLLLLKHRIGVPKGYTAEFTSSLRKILLGKQARPARWVALAAARRMSGRVVYKAYPLSQRGKLIGFPFQGTHSLGNYQSDNAVDISCSRGTRIVAPIPGRLFGGYGYLGLGGSRFMGQRVNMVGRYKQRTVSFYFAHMSTIVVRPFARVSAGQTIGYCGPANGVWHLHLGASYGFPILAFVTGRY